MKVNFKKPFLDINDQEVRYQDNNQPVMINQLLAAQLFGAIEVNQEKDIMRYFDWASDLRRGGEIDLTEADQREVKDFIYKHRGLSVMQKGQILKCFDDGNHKKSK